MSREHLPKHYKLLNEKYPEYIKAVKDLGRLVSEQGPLSAKTVQLVQLAAAVANRSQGSVHSHTRRALAEGASPDEIRHAVIALTSTLGFPQVAAALSWLEEVLED